MILPWWRIANVYWKRNSAPYGYLILSKTITQWEGSSQLLKEEGGLAQNCLRESKYLSNIDSKYQENSLKTKEMTTQDEREKIYIKLSNYWFWKKVQVQYVYYNFYFTHRIIGLGCITFAILNETEWNSNSNIKLSTQISGKREENKGNDKKM